MSKCQIQPFDFFFPFGFSLVPPLLPRSRADVAGQDTLIIIII